MSAVAAGLGKLTVISGLGEPLSAEVELLSASQEELSSLSAQIAPAEIFAEQGIERASALSSIKVEVSQRPDGTPVLRLSSPGPINDPFLDMLIQVEWSSGRLLREYTALLDPPGFGEQMATPAVAADSGSTQGVMPGSPGDKVPGKSGVHPSRADADAPVTDGYTTRKGDTLHAIATQTQLEGVSLEQMLVGLYRANKEAFSGNNMNRLKVGQIIHVPSQEELQAIGKSEAAKEIRVQTADWNAYRNNLAGMVKESAPAMEESSRQASSGKIAAPAEDKSIPPAPGPRDVVKLSKSETGATAKASGADVSGRLTALQEEATAREKAVKESGERVAALEKQLQDMQKLLEIKNKSLAETQKGAQAPAPVAPAVKPEAPKEAAKPVEPAPPAPPPAVEPGPAVPQPAVEKPEPPKPAAKAPEKKPKKILRPVPQPKPEPGMLDGLLANPLVPAGAGGLLVLIGGAWFYMRNKRRKGLDSFEQGILTTGGLKPNTVFGNTAGGTVDTGNTSFLTDFEQGATSGMIDTHEVDPIAEAEVYMAYGRDVQAEEILKDAIGKEPKRYELHLKLLEIFANRKDSGAFETLAGELYATLGATDPTWAKVAEIGHKFEPDNPLYSASSIQPKEGPQESTDFDATMIQQAPAVPVEDVATGMDVGAAGPETTLDFSLDEPAQVAAESTGEEAAAESNTLDFDIGGLELPAEVSSEAAVETEAPVEDLDLSLNLDSDAGMSLDMPEVSAETAGMDFALDLPEPVADSSAQLDAADLGMGSLSDLESGLPEVAADESVEVAAAEEVSLDMPGLELPSLEAAEPVADISLEASPDDSGLSLDLPAEDSSVAEPVSLDIDLGGELELPEVAEEPIVQESVEEVATALELPAEEAVQDAALEMPSGIEIPAEPEAAAGGLDFNFDVDLGEPEPVAEKPETTAAAPLPDLDLSGISLDVAESVPAADLGDTEEITLGPSSESADVDTKLDLVTAYVDMGDQEGARELLQEVLKEGGPSQREKAQKLLDGLG